MRLLGIILVVLSPFTTNAEEVLQNCDGTTTDEISTCNETRYRGSDAQLNVAYKELLSEISPEHREQLIETQRAWISFKERHCDIVYESIHPGQEAAIEKYICLWKMTDDRLREISRLGTIPMNDEFHNFILSLHSLGFPREEITSKLRDRYIDEEGGWQEYATQNCRLSKLASLENFEICMARVAAQRGSN